MVGCWAQVACPPAVAVAVVRAVHYAVVALAAWAVALSAASAVGDGELDADHHLEGGTFADIIGRRELPLI